jgi:hypothetical protein
VVVSDDAGRRRAEAGPGWRQARAAGSARSSGAAELVICPSGDSLIAVAFLIGRVTAQVERLERQLHVLAGPFGVSPPSILLIVRSMTA